MKQADVVVKTPVQKNVNDILGQMNEANKGFYFEVYVPTLKRNVMFAQLTAKQQKNLVKAIVDNPIFNTEFIMTFRGILKENCAEPEINIDNLSVFDKLVIALKMRSVSIDDKISITLTSPSNEKGVTRVIKVSDLYDECLEKVKPFEVTISDTIGVYSVECSLPTIGDEFNMEHELRSKLETKINLKTEEDARKALSDIYINEFVKYIKTIRIQKEGVESVVDMSKYNFTDRITIASKLPGMVNTEIFKYIKSIQDEFNKAILFTEKDENNQIIQHKIKLDPNFFIIS